jgi:hypothetical protein
MCHGYEAPGRSYELVIQPDVSSNDTFSAFSNLWFQSQNFVGASPI